ncbi:MAG: hypothetical protein WDW38_010853 [Sanguina aurantia]
MVQLAARSADTLFSRAVLLKSAVECLSSEDQRRSYDLKLKHGSSDLRVSQPDLPGALVLLQEVGEPQDVIDLSIAWLTNNASSPDACDVATCAAMAFCDRASATLHSSSGGGGGSDAAGSGTAASAVSSKAILPACQDLEHALGLMGQHPASSQQLREQIEEALQDMASQHAVQLLALPLSTATTVHREKGLRLLRWELQRLTQEQGAPVQEEGPTCNALADDLIDTAREWLTAQEQVSLLPDFKSSPASQSAVLYDTALALIAVGHSHGWPHLIHQADAMLQEVEAVSNASGDPAAVNPVSVERCSCAVLLGDTRSAVQLLGMAEGSLYPIDADVSAFVQEHSPEEGDLSPGVRVMSQQWLEVNCLSMFREGAAAGEKPLDDWFSCPRVKAYLGVRTMTQAEPLLQAAHFLCNATKLILMWLSPLAAALSHWAQTSQAAVATALNNAKPTTSPASTSAFPSSSQPANTSSSSKIGNSSSSNNQDSVQRRRRQNESQPGGRIQEDPSFFSAGERSSGGVRGRMESRGDATQQTRAALVADRSSEGLRPAVPAASGEQPGFEDEDDEEPIDSQSLESMRGANGQNADAMRSQLQGLELAMWDSPQGFAANADKAKIAVKLMAVTPATASLPTTPLGTAAARQSVSVGGQDVL